ncbi:MAG: nucleotidyltransferase family protein, partial [Planctomycetota bacterium]
MRREIIGLIPAGGKGSRIAPLPCSKELYPIGFRTVDNNKNLRPKVISHYLLEKMRLADITKAYIILREGKWDIPSYFGDGKLLDMNLAYLIMDLPFGVPYTLDQAYPFIQDSLIALGFPDTICQPEDAYAKLIAKLEDSGADIVLGLFPASQPHKTDMVELDHNGNVRSIYIKPDKTQLFYAWEIAIWTPVFTKFMHDYVLSRQKLYLSGNLKDQDELYVGDVIQAAIQDNMRVDSVLFKDGNCVDIGTPEDLLKAM